MRLGRANVSDPNFGKTDALIAFHRLDTSESIFRFIQTSSSTS